MKRVSMYTLSTCPWCRKTKKFFKDHGIPFDYVDYDLASPEEQAKIREDVKKYTDNLAFPFVKIDGDVVSGYNPEKYEELIKRKQVA